VCLAIPCLLKIYPLAIGLLVGVLFPRQLLPRLAAALALGAALPFACQTPGYVLEQYRQYASWALEQDRTTWPLHNAPHDFYFLTRWLGIPLDRSVYLAMQTGAVAVVVGLCVALQRRGADHATLARRLLGLGIGCIICFGPATESSTFTLLAPVLAWEVYAAWTAGSRGICIAMTCVYALLCASGMSMWFAGGRRFAQVLQPLAGLIHLGTQVWLARTWRDSAGADQRRLAA
jgi:hypothetical protein